MIPRIGLDLEPGTAAMRVIPGLDLLDIAYAATHGGAQIIIAPARLLFESEDYDPGLFDRPGLPLFAVKAEPTDLDRLPALGGAADRIVIAGERNLPVLDPQSAAESARRGAAAGQDIGVLIEPDAAALKEISRARVNWAYFSTLRAFESATSEEAEAEIARLTSAALAANRLNLRTALWGPTGRHLPAALCAIPYVEEVYPTPDLWAMALRSGWERAVADYARLMR
ncbi:hypothetical protein KKH27_05240 [bacterium]|nr:hypothetical protein [bacterium]MBU1982845.1 hypothetical protein [bacterium]